MLTDVTEEHITSIYRVKEEAKQETSMKALFSRQQRGAL
jgi:hypothetical protein